jgi:hypothetical protein
MLPFLVTAHQAFSRGFFSNLVKGVFYSIIQIQTSCTSIYHAWTRGRMGIHVSPRAVSRIFLLGGPEGEARVV